MIMILFAVLAILLCVSTSETRAAGRKAAKPYGRIGWIIAALILAGFVFG